MPVLLFPCPSCQMMEVMNAPDVICDCSHTQQHRHGLGLHGYHQYIKILTCVCVSVCVSVSDGIKWDVRGAGLDYSDARPSYFNLFTEPRTPRRMFENIGLESSWGCKRMHAIGEQQLKRTQSGSSSWKRTQTGSSGCNRAREQQLIRSGCKWRAAAEADAIGELQLCTESCPAPDYSR